MQRKSHSSSHKNHDAGPNRGHRPTRRSLIGSAAVTVGLPFLDSIGFSRTRRARAAACDPKKRFLGWYQPNGFVMPAWTPQQTGKAWTAPMILKPLEAIRNKAIVLSGLENQEVAQARAPIGNHAGGTGPFLNQLRIAGKENDKTRTSLDQKIAGVIGACTTLPSVQLGIEPSISTGNCDGAPCSFSRVISWSNGTPLANVHFPDIVFQRLFEGVNQGASDADAKRRNALRASVLDHVAREAQSLSISLASSDRSKLDEYLTGIRDLETRIQKLSAAAADTGQAQCPLPAAPPHQLEFRTHVDLMIDLMALAFHCDSTRVISFMISQSGSGRDYSFLGASGGYHFLSHHKGDQVVLEKLKKIGVWQVEKMVDLAKKLDAIDDGGGRTVLDNTLIFFSSEISDGDRHNHYDLPVLLAGGLGGAIKGQGEHMAFTKYTFPRPLVGPTGGRSMGDLFLSILRGFGIPDSTFGENGKNPITEILA